MTSKRDSCSRLRAQVLAILLMAGIVFPFVSYQYGCASGPLQGTTTAAKPYDEHVKCQENKAQGAKDCRIDLFLTRGFRAFSQCQVCHGLDGNGSSFAPGLNTFMLENDRARFDEVITNGYTGQIGVMPGWKENPNVMKYLDNLYLYLLARADGAIPAGKIERYDR